MLNRTGVTAATIAVVALTLSAACGGSTTSSTGPASSSSTGAGGGTGGGGGSDIGNEESWIIETGSGGCNTILYDPPDIGGKHVDECSKITWHSNPPTSGNHYGIWAAYKTYDEAVPRGYAVHAQEHGAVVLSYNCADGCPAEVTAMQTFIDGLPEDPACSGGVLRRVILTPDPNLNVQFAMSSWGHMLKADCFDAALAGAFVEAYYLDGPEDLCGGGQDPFAGSGGGGGLPAGCGE
ncbi:DUF3105 domain-containing protein [Desulfobulbus sp. AH-315-M07]|nr:DUF3105 domain-containing protein [Desulfobulbus sp. AH-315-M07]